MKVPVYFDPADDEPYGFSFDPETGTLAIIPF